MISWFSLSHQKALCEIVFQCKGYCALCIDRDVSYQETHITVGNTEGFVNYLKMKGILCNSINL